ncbi:MAG: 5'/3'-nucleotidase SurE [Thermodesulfovibrionales bacterium]|nr:5'/3'-nucleotidase SurE [Thermodesulfovibrionales bacterium]
MKPLILVTNDDGVYSDGITTLFNAMREIADAYIVAPDRERSAVSHALTMHRPLRVEMISDFIYTVNGTPTDCVALAINKILPRKPDVVASGINKGANLGDDVTYSGTVSAAIEGTILNVPSFAISLVGNHPFLFETAVPYAKKVAQYIIENSLPYDTLLNVNVPNVPPDDIKGIKLTRQGKRIYENSIKDVTSPWGDTYYWIGGGQPYYEHGEGMDIQAVMDGYVSITPLHLDFTNYEALELLKKRWAL